MDEPAAARLAYAGVRQRVADPGFRARVRARLVERAAAAAGDAPGRDARERAAAALAELDRKVGRAAENLALCETPGQRAAVAAVFERLRAEREAAAAAAPVPVRASPAAEVAAAEAGLDRLEGLAAAGPDVTAALLRAADARLYLRFEAVRHGRQRRSRVAGGVLTLGSHPPPVAVYDGPTDRAFVLKALAAGRVLSSTPDGCSCNAEPGDGMSGVVQRLTWRCSRRRPKAGGAAELGRSAAEAHRWRKPKQRCPFPRSRCSGCGS